MSSSCGMSILYVAFIRGTTTTTTMTTTMMISNDDENAKHATIKRRKECEMKAFYCRRISVVNVVDFIDGM